MDPFQINSEVFLLTQNVSKIFLAKKKYARSAYLRDLPTLMILLDETNDLISSQSLPASDSTKQALDVCVGNFNVMCECLKEHRWSSSSGLKNLMKALFSRDRAELEHTVDSFRKSVIMLRQISMDIRTRESLAELTDMVRGLDLRYQSMHTTNEGLNFSDSALVSAYTGLTRTQAVFNRQLVQVPIEQPSLTEDTDPPEQIQRSRASRGHPFAMTVEVFVKDVTTGRHKYIPVRILLDTGADVNIVPGDLLRRHSLTSLTRPVPKKTHMGHGEQTITSEEEIDLDWFSIKSTKTHRATFCVFDGPARYDLLLGQEWLSENKDWLPDSRGSSVLTLFTQRRSKETRKREKREKLEADRRAQELIKSQDEEEKMLRSSSSLGISPIRRISLSSIPKDNSGAWHSPTRSLSRQRQSLGPQEPLGMLGESSADAESSLQATASPVLSSWQTTTPCMAMRESLSGVVSSSQAQEGEEVGSFGRVAHITTSEARRPRPEPRISTDDGTGRSSHIALTTDAGNMLESTPEVVDTSPRDPDPVVPVVLLVNGQVTPLPSESNSQELRPSIPDEPLPEKDLVLSHETNDVVSNGNLLAPQSLSPTISTEAQFNANPTLPFDALTPRVSKNGEQRMMEET